MGLGRGGILMPIYNAGQYTPPTVVSKSWAVNRALASTDGFGEIELPVRGNYKISIRGSASRIEVYNDSPQAVIISANVISKGNYIGLNENSYTSNESQSITLDKRQCNIGKWTYIAAITRDSYTSQRITYEFTITPVSPEYYENTAGSGRLSTDYSTHDPAEYMSGIWYGKIISFPCEDQPPSYPNPYMRYHLIQFDWSDVKS